MTLNSNLSILLEATTIKGIKRNIIIYIIIFSNEHSTFFIAYIGFHNINGTYKAKKITN